MPALPLLQQRGAGCPQPPLRPLQPCHGPAVGAAPGAAALAPARRGVRGEHPFGRISSSVMKIAFLGHLLALPLFEQGKSTGIFV